MNRKQTVSTVLLGAALTAALSLPASAAQSGCAAGSCAGRLCPRLSGLGQAEDCTLSTGCVQLPDTLPSRFCLTLDRFLPSDSSEATDNAEAADSAETPDAEETPASGEASGEDSRAASPSSASGSETASVSAYEQEVVDLVNEIRAGYGLSALTLSEQLCDGARLKSQDMQQNGYFSHESPTYGTPFQMMQSLGISYSVAAENIAMGQSTPQEVVTAWMNSESHRANILSESFTLLGVGYVANGNYWTQWFVG